MLVVSPFGFLLHEVARLMRAHFNRLIQAEGLTLAQSRVLIQLSHCDGQRQVDLAERLEVQPMTVGRLVDQLASSGMVERRADPLDRRVFRIFLLPGAQPLLERIAAVAEETRRVATAGMSAELLAQTNEALALVKQNLLLSGAAHGAADPSCFPVVE